MADTIQDENGDPNLSIITVYFCEYLKQNFNLTAEFLSRLYGMNGMSDEAITNSEHILTQSSPVSELLHLLHERNKKGTYKAFIECLRYTEGNSHHADFIQGYSQNDEIESRNLCRHVMQAFFIELTEKMNPIDILPHTHCFSNEEKDNVLKVIHNYGSRRGALAHLGILFKKGMEGFGQLLEGLRHAGNAKLATELAEIISSSRSKDGPSILSPKVVDMDIDCTLGSSSSYTGTIVGRQVVFEGETRMEENTSGCDLSTGTWNQTEMGELNLLSRDNQSLNINDTETENDEMQASGDTIQPIRLHSYQQELVAAALMGKNSVIVAATGSGKTVVAARVAKAFFDRESGVGQRLGNPPRVINSGSNKVIFLVNKVPLVEQQCNLFRKFMDDETDIMGLTGSEMNSSGSLADMLEMKDVLVMTAQILVNALQNPEQGSDQPMDLSQIGLLILDECHHCKKGDPYNAVMAHYSDLKILSPDTPRPQILGLTASMGVGKASGQYGAETHILKVCANLDAEELCTVQNLQNKEELQQKGINHRKIFSEPRRKDDSFVKEINIIMEKMEAKISQTHGGATWLKQSSCPKRGTQVYENWLVEMGKFFAENILGDDDQTLLMTCKDHLKVLNDSLYINRDARTQDAVNRYLHYIEKLEETTEDLNPVERELVALFRDKIAHLQMLATSQDTAHQNPLLKRLSQILTDSMATNPDSRGIVFCRTRDTTEALIACIEATPSLKFLNPGKLIGCGGSEGLTQTKQEELLDMFRKGKRKLIVATSVAEEGIDIQECNYVIRYNYISNEIGRVQTQGRSRARGSKFYLVVSEELGLADRETTNRIREKTMYAATESIRKMSKHDFLTQIVKFQKESHRERKLKEALLAKIKHDKQLMSVQLVCRKCPREVCTLDDIRCIENAHHVVLNDTFIKRCRLIPHPKPVVKKDFEKLMRIMCGNPKCPQEWGIQMKYKGCMVFALTPVNFVFKLNTGRKRLFNKWKDMPYKITAMSMDMLEELADVAMVDREENEEQSDEEEETIQESIYQPS